MSVTPYAWSNDSLENACLYYSDNGYEWKNFPFEEIKLFSEEQKTVFIQPDKPGYWYFRASYNDISHEVASSDVLVVPVLPFEK